MVKKQMILKLSKRLSELCEANGVSSNLAVINFMDNECDVEIPRDLANERAEAIGKICAELRKVRGVVSIYDNGADRVIGKGQVRRFEILVDEDSWTETEEDDFVAERELRALFDKKYAAQEKAKQLEDRRRNWREYLIPLPKPDGNTNTELYLTMAYEPYDWIKNGYIEDGKRVYKQTEFRAYNERYMKRLLGHPIKTVKFQRGYGGPGRPKPEQMVFEVKSITLWDSRAKLECDPRKPVEGIVPDFFAINLGKRVS